MLRRNGDGDGARVRGDTASRIVAPPRRIRATTRDAPARARRRHARPARHAHADFT
ncbi:hypothetical protein BURMUCF2_3457 [Burkholderia multivorans CF2]|nr:hypothetical protein BURMUCF2_3457 [Burkholderia multivorans CF2]